MKTKLFVIVLRIAVVILLLSSLTFCSSGCRSTKETLKTKVDTKIESTINAKTSVDSTSNVVDKSISNVITDEVITISDLSKPDSVGKQYPTRVTTITRKQNSAVKSDVKKELKVQSKSGNKTSIKQKTSEKQTVTKKSSTKTPVIVFVAILALLTGLFFAFKRYLK